MIAEGLIDGGYFAAAGRPEIAEMNQHFFDHLLECFSIGTEDLAKVEQELYHIHYIFISFHPSAQWHYTEAAIDYLIEDYPEFDAFCKSYITSILHLDMACPSSQYLFHHYLSLLVSVVTLEEIVAPIKICLDFSYGEKYNRIIAQHMKHAIDTPVQLQRNVCVDTEIILSDILNKDTNCPVVMHWSTSPKQSDWASLKAQIRQIRRDRTNQAIEAFAAHKEIS